MTSYYEITITLISFFLSSDPLPGGCNMEFNLENDPNFHLYYNSFTIYLDFEWANIGFARDVMPLSCESKTDQARLRYDIYAYYIGEEDLTELSFLKAIKNMADPEFIVKHAMKVRSWIQCCQCLIAMTPDMLLVFYAWFSLLGLNIM